MAFRGLLTEYVNSRIEKFNENEKIGNDDFLQGLIKEMSIYLFLLLINYFRK